MSGPALATAPKEEGFAKMRLYFHCSSLSHSLETVPTLSEAETAGQRRNSDAEQRRQLIQLSRPVSIALSLGAKWLALSYHMARVRMKPGRHKMALMPLLGLGAGGGKASVSQA